MSEPIDFHHRTDYPLQAGGRLCADRAWPRAPLHRPALADGCRAADGSTIKLETIRSCNASTMTSVQALQRFFDRLTGTPDPVRRDSVKQELSAPLRNNSVKQELAAWGLTRPAQ